METTENIQQAPTALFSLEELNKIGNNDPSFTRQMLEKFVNQVIECSEAMRSAITEGNWANLKSAAHKYIPSYSILGLDELVNLLRYTEMQAQKNKEYKHMSEIVEIICEKNNAVLSAIRNHLKLTG